MFRRGPLGPSHKCVSNILDPTIGITIFIGICPTTTLLNLPSRLCDAFLVTFSITFVIHYLYVTGTRNALKIDSIMSTNGHCGTLSDHSWVGFLLHYSRNVGYILQIVRRSTRFFSRLANISQPIIAAIK